jgi:hypothetical protein
MLLAIFWPMQEITSKTRIMCLGLATSDSMHLIEVV